MLRRRHQRRITSLIFRVSQPTCCRKPGICCLICCCSCGSLANKGWLSNIWKRRVSARAAGWRQTRMISRKEFIVEMIPSLQPLSSSAACEGFLHLFFFFFFNNSLDKCMNGRKRNIVQKLGSWHHACHPTYKNIYFQWIEKQLPWCGWMYCHLVAYLYTTISWHHLFFFQTLLSSYDCVYQHLNAWIHFTCNSFQKCFSSLVTELLLQ